MAVAFKGRGRGSNNTGGGYLHGVTGVINSITFKEGKSGENKNGPWTMYSLVATITPDGGEPKPQFFDAGFLPRGASISKDGKSIVGGDNYYLDAETPAGKFIFSMEGKIDDALFGDGRNYDQLAGTRATFSRVRDEDATIAAGLRKLKLKEVTDENRARVIEAGKRPGSKDKTKKFFLDNLLVAEVVAAPAAKKGGKKTTTAAAPTAAPAAATTSGVTTEQADAAIKAIVGAAEDKTLAREKLSAAVLRYSVGLKPKLGRDDMEALRQLVVSDDYLNGAVERELILLDGEGKSQSVVLIG